MLEVLRLRHLAVIESAELEFGPGLNILSGETGSGKSIIVEAIGLLLGARASGDLIRKGESEASVEGLFDCRELPSLRPLLESMGIPFPRESALLIRRQLTRSGESGFRQRAYLNGVLVPLNQVQEIGSHLIDLCSQHEHQTLLRAPQQILWLDRFAQIESVRIELEVGLSHVRRLQSELLHWDQRETERLKELDFIRFQVAELEGAQLQAGEEEELQNRKRLLQSVEARRVGAEGIQAAFEGEEESLGIIAALQRADSVSRSIGNLDPELTPLVERLSCVAMELSDVAHEWARYASRLDASEEELSLILARLSDLQHLKRKYGDSIEEMTARLDHLRSRLDALDTEGGDLESLRVALSVSLAALIDVDVRLQKLRDQAGFEFSKRVTAELHALDMTSATLQVVAGESQSVEEWSSGFGSRMRQWLIQTNAGEAAQSLQKIVSGGELSRIMLAIRQVVTGSRSVGVYLFDEIDSGMGGRTAFVVGQKLKAVARGSQVICITHLPQVAAFSDQHFQVEKHESKGRTRTDVRKLTDQERSFEIARMLSGHAPTPSSLRNADELLQQARGKKASVSSKRPVTGAALATGRTTPKKRAASSGARR